MDLRQNIQCSFESIQVLGVDPKALRLASPWGSRRTVVSNASFVLGVISRQFFAGQKSKKVHTIVDRYKHDRLV
jgi:hypothetical protein